LPKFIYLSIVDAEVESSLTEEEAMTLTKEDIEKLSTSVNS
jgi:hypothetical protein